MAHALNPSTWKADAGKFVIGHPVYRASSKPTSNSKTVKGGKEEENPASTFYINTSHILKEQTKKFS